MPNPNLLHWWRDEEPKYVDDKNFVDIRELSPNGQRFLQNVYPTQAAQLSNAARDRLMPTYDKLPVEQRINLEKLFQQDSRNLQPPRYGEKSGKRMAPVKEADISSALPLAEILALLNPSSRKFLTETGTQAPALGIMLSVLQKLSGKAKKGLENNEFFEAFRKMANSGPGY